ncbi:hypothetical protein HELRODRAFT_67002 [Helobdella robusta]|uniref:Wiskott-Aldrich syndrome protein family member n=1 Tax=Helobdella robusta TaxID=6412 RepID=T1FYV0_HELRO|nr:hypothetical protein HELRODRAFT_67002 [Helobdella robusta]ESN99223.1 hypothetical protein HELRODRAFT_67002 [Helobdella robusta]
MPLHKRLIEPVNVSRNVVAEGIRNELDCVSNSTLSHIILQLSSLSKLSEDIFLELHVETCNIFFKTCHIYKRVELLKHKIVQLNPVVEEVSLHDINQRLPFKSETQKDQEVVTISTRPRAINDVYQCIEPAPPLHHLNQFRDDGRDSMTFYTDPSYFFELWKCEMVKDAENQMKKQRHKVKKVTSFQ